jgi:hypothetical protein
LGAPGRHREGAGARPILGRADAATRAESLSPRPPILCVGSCDTTPARHKPRRAAPGSLPAARRRSSRSAADPATLAFGSASAYTCPLALGKESLQEGQQSMSPGTPTWARLLLLVGATGVTFVLSAGVVYFLASLASQGPALPPGRESVPIEETTGALTTDEVTQTTEETTTTSVNKSPPESPRESPRESPQRSRSDSSPESSPTATATATATAPP